MGSGCCPTGQICDTSATCYDHFSSNCSDTASPNAGCCPADTPYCRDFEPNGLGCYASSTTATSSRGGGMSLRMSSNELGLSTTIASAVVTSLSPSMSSYSILFLSTQDTSSTKTSAFCHDDDSKTPVPCPVAPGIKTTGSSSTSMAITEGSDIGYSPPGTSVYKAQACKVVNPFSTSFGVARLWYTSVLRFLLFHLYNVHPSLESGDRPPAQECAA